MKKTAQDFVREHKKENEKLYNVRVHDYFAL